jgi:hypothetical protein
VSDYADMVLGWNSWGSGYQVGYQLWMSQSGERRLEVGVIFVALGKC